MQRLRYTLTANLPQLQEELLAAVPALRPQPGPDGRNVATHILTGTNTEVWLEVPDGLDATLLTAVVKAHVPKPGGLVPTREELLASVNNATTLADLKRALLAVLSR